MVTDAVMCKLRVRQHLPLVVGLDGGYVHSCTQRTRRDGWFEVIAGKAMPADGRSSCFGY